MGGLTRLFTRILPIITLICFICLGINHTFGQTDEDNNALTYLTSEVITINDNNTETTTDDTTIRNYNFDIKTYAESITNESILKDALLNTIDIETFRQNIQTYNTLWEDGYQLLDISKSILNTFVLLINGFLTITNVIIAPFRLIGAILLTAMSLIGININRDKGIIKLLRTISLYAVIPLIGSNNEIKPDDKLTGTTWYLDDNIPTETITKIKGNFISNGQVYDTITFSYEYMGSIEQITYELSYNIGQKKLIYSNGYTDDADRKITFLNNDFTDEKSQEMKTLMLNYATQMIDNTIWQFNNNLYNPYTATYTFDFSSYETQGKYKQMIIIANQGIWYVDTNNNQIQVYNSINNTWIYNDSKTIKIETANYTIQTSNQVWIFMSQHATRLTL